MNLKHLQNNLPWTVPYSKEFVDSKEKNGHRQTSHDILHIMKSVGRIADGVERTDHNSIPLLAISCAVLSKELASIVMSVMHISSTYRINLEEAILYAVYEKNGTCVPKEPITHDCNDSCPHYQQGR